MSSKVSEGVCGVERCSEKVRFPWLFLKVVVEMVD